MLLTYAYLTRTGRAQPCTACTAVHGRLCVRVCPSATNPPTRRAAATAAWTRRWSEVLAMFGCSGVAGRGQHSLSKPMARAARASQRPGPRSSTACLISPMERGLISHVVGLMLPQSAPACQAWMKHVRPPTLAAQEVMGESLPPLAQREFPPLLWAGATSPPH